MGGVTSHELSSYCLLLLLHYFAQGILVPVLSMMLLAGGIPLSDLAFAIGVYSVTAVVLELPTGVLADLIGKKKIYLSSLAATVVSMSFFLIGGGKSAMFVGIALFGAARALASGSFEALFLDRYATVFGDLSKGVRILTVSESAGLVVGSLLGGVLPILSVRVGMQTYVLSLIVRIGLTLLIGILLVILIPTDHPKHTEPSHRLRTQLRSCASVFSDSRIIRLLFLVLVGTGFLLILLKHIGSRCFSSFLQGSVNASVWLGILSSLILVQHGGNVLSERMMRSHSDKRRIYLLGRIGMVLFLFAGAMVRNPVLFFVFFCLLYFCFGMANVAEGTLLNARLNESNRASVLSMQSLVLQLGVVIASVCSKLLPDTVGIGGLWLISSAVLWLCCCRLRTKKKTSEEVLS
jgi:MFS family permease